MLVRRYSVGRQRVVVRSSVGRSHPLLVPQDFNNRRLPSSFRSYRSDTTLPYWLANRAVSERNVIP
jgi:hypothetical protein